MSDLVLSAQGLRKDFGKTTALKGVDIDLAPGAFTVLLGAAGAGKTTTLRTIAGLEVPTAGRVMINGEEATAREPKDRDIAMIFDSLALYPNKTGFENMAHPLRIRKMPDAEIEAKINAVAATLQVTHILSRLPKTMSGGERQRIALGRALVRDPAFFLLDEPLSSLDAQLRVELRAELKRLQRDHNYAFLYATPDYTEALAVADTVVMLIDGEVRQVGAPQDIYDRPIDRDVARFVGAPEINLLQAEYDPADGGRIRIADMLVPADADVTHAFNGSSVAFEAGIRPENFSIAAPGAGPANAEVVDYEALGLNAALTVEADCGPIRVVVPAGDATAFPVGMRVTVSPAANGIMAFDPADGRRLSS